MDNLIDFNSPSLRFSAERFTILSPYRNKFHNLLEKNADELLVSPHNASPPKLLFNLSSKDMNGNGSPGMFLGKESLNGRESLGILHQMDTTDFGRESLFDLNSPQVIDAAVKTPTIVLHLNNNDVSLAVDDNVVTNKPLVMKSTSSSTSSYNNFSKSLLEPSKIYSESDTKLSNVLNEAFADTNNFVDKSKFSDCFMSSIHSPLNRGKLFTCSDEVDEHARIKSLPDLESKFDGIDTSDKQSKTTVGRQFLSVGKIQKAKPFKRGSFHGTLDFDEREESNDFNDSVFIEAQHLASKLADGSILDESSKDTDVLYCTPEPDWPELSDDDVNDTKPNKETVFKKVDMMLPPAANSNSSKLQHVSTVSDESTSGRSNDVSDRNSKLIQNLSEVLYENKFNSSRKSNASKDAKEMLHNLSEILNCSRRSDLQKSEGQNLLHSLAGMFCDNNAKSSSLEDSGNSSIMESAPEEVPVFKKHQDLRSKSISMCHSEVVMNLSSKLSLTQNRKVSRSFSASNVLPSNLSRTSVNSSCGNKTGGSSFASDTSNASKNRSESSTRALIAGKIKSKKVELGGGLGIRKGPLKAVIPVGEMAKIQKNPPSLSLTPRRSEQRQSMVQSKRTSTPTNESKIKPMAQSTPTNRKIPLAVAGREAAASPQIQPRSVSSGSQLNKLKLEAPGRVRRNSVSEIKKPSGFDIRPQRSSSTGRNSGIMSALSKVRQNILSSPYYQNKMKKTPCAENNNSFGLSDNKNVPIASKALDSKVKRAAGKENLVI